MRYGIINFLDALSNHTIETIFFCHLLADRSDEFIAVFPNPCAVCPDIPCAKRNPSHIGRAHAYEKIGFGHEMKSQILR